MTTLIETLFSVDKTKRSDLLKGLLPLTKKGIFDSAITLTEILNLKEDEDREVRTKKKQAYILANPNELHWDFAEYYPIEYKQGGKTKKNLRPLGIIPNVKISTAGDIIFHHRGVNKLFITRSIESNPTRYVRIRLGKLKYPVHRILGCTFFPLPEKIKHHGISKLTINHINLKVSDNHFSNLEWVTQQENNRHGIVNGARVVGTRYYKNTAFLMEVIADNKFKGTKYVLKGLDQVHELGFRIPSLRQVIKGTKTSLFGHTVKDIELDQIGKYHLGMPDDLKMLYKNNKNYFSTDIKPVIGTVLTGPYTGFEFSLIGATEINIHFIQANVHQCLCGKRAMHRNCAWRYCTLDEAIQLTNKLTPKIVATLRPLNR